MSNQLMNEPTKKMIHAYEMGLDCGRNGPNETNCDFRIFSEEFYTLAWDLGKEKGLAEKGMLEDANSVPLEYGQRDPEKGLLVIRCRDC
ncbi:MAG: hypothetical protein ACE5FB_02345 [Candidatus Binatia bacterium]